MGSEVKFNTCLRLLTYENIIFMSKIVREWLKNCAPIQFLLFGIAWDCIFVGQILTKSSKIPYYCSPPSLFGHV